MPSGFEFPSYLRTLIAEDDAARDHAAARTPRVVELDTAVASVTGIDEARARLHPSPLAALLVDDRPWQDAAACLGVTPGLFFPADGAPVQLDQARRVCAGCVVRDECLEWALEHNERHGVWGGLSERERRRLRKQRRSGAA